MKLRAESMQRLMTHPGVGALTALSFVLIIGKAERFRCGRTMVNRSTSNRNGGCGQLYEGRLSSVSLN